MKKHMFTRAFFGFSVGVTIGTLITILISAVEGDGEFVAVIPQMQAFFGTQLAAMAAQTLWLGVIGVVFAEAALFFEQERWSTVWQYMVHFLVTGVVYLPFLLICYVPVQARTVLFILGNILLTYGISWTIQYQISRKNVESINAALERRQRGERN